jgi:hypothetical protein
LVVEHQTDAIFVVGEGGLGELDKSAKRGVQIFQEKSAFLVSQFAVLSADQPLIQRKVTTFTFPHCNGALVVKIYDEFFDLVA